MGYLEVKEIEIGHQKSKNTTHTKKIENFGRIGSALEVVNGQMLAASVRANPFEIPVPSD